MNREQRLRKAAPTAPEEAVAAVAALPLPVVNHVLVLLRDARKNAVAEHRELRRQRRREARKFRWYDEHQLAERNSRIVQSSGKRAADGNLDALTSLANLAAHAHEMIPLAVDGLRARGYSDTEIGLAMGITRQAVGQHYGRRSSAPVDLTAAGPARCRP